MSYHRPDPRDLAAVRAHAAALNELFGSDNESEDARRGRTGRPEAAQRDASPHSDDGGDSVADEPMRLADATSGLFSSDDESEHEPMEGETADGVQSPPPTRFQRYDGASPPFRFAAQQDDVDGDEQEASRPATRDVPPRRNAQRTRRALPYETPRARDSARRGRGRRPRAEVDLTSAWLTLAFTHSGSPIHFNVQHAPSGISRMDVDL